MGGIGAARKGDAALVGRIAVSWVGSRLLLLLWMRGSLRISWLLPLRLAGGSRKPEVPEADDLRSTKDETGAAPSHASRQRVVLPCQAASVDLAAVLFCPVADGVPVLGLSAVPAHALLRKRRTRSWVASSSGSIGSRLNLSMSLLMLPVLLPRRRKHTVCHQHMTPRYRCSLIRFRVARRHRLSTSLLRASPSLFAVSLPNLLTVSRVSLLKTDLANPSSF